MDFGSAQQEEQVPALDSGEPTPDEVWNYMAENRYRTFDHTTPQGRRMFELFEVANKEKNTFSFNMVKEMANIVASVPKDIAVGLVQNPLKAPMSALDGVARDINDLYGLLAQSEDPASPLFKFKEYLTGNGTTEERIKQFNEARMFNNKSQELQDGKRTMLEDFVPEEHKEFIKSMIDPKLANALSYIGLETPHLLLKPFSARKALRQSVGAFKTSDAMRMAEAADVGSAMSEMIAPIREHFNNVAERGKNFASRITGTAITGTANAIATPFSVIQSKIESGARNIAETTGSHPNVIRNAASTALADAGETIVGGGAASLSPIRSTLFSLGVKPLTEYASALGNEIIDYSQGVVAVKTEHMGKSMLERLSLKNGSRIPLSEEARMVAKFTNVVVGWPASMAMPVLKSAVGDAAYMGVLGYLNARGEGAAGAMGVGFAWGGISGSFRHIHNVYNGGLGQENVIKNWDSQINEIEKNSPRHGSALREVVSQIDKLNDQRISAVVRASYMQLWSVDKAVELRFSDASEVRSEFPNIFRDVPNPEEHRGGSFGYQTDKSGVQKKVIWLNKADFVPEAHLHEPAHALFDHLEETDADFPNLIRQFFGLDNPDVAVLSDDALASLMSEYKARQMSVNPSYIPEIKKNYLNRISKMREEVKNGSVNPNELVSGGKSRLFEAYPELREIMTEMFAYSASNQQLLKTPDFFARHPESNTLRNHLENLHTLMNQKQVSKAEMAGLIIKEQRMGNKDVAFQTFMWEDGTYRSVEPLDKWCETLMRKCLRHGDIDAYTMSPDRLDSFLKTTGKDRFGQVVKGGKTMKDRKEVDILITENAGQMLDIWEKMDPAKRPKIDVEQGGNKKIDLTNVPKEGWDALYGNINMTKSEIDDLRGICETIRDNRAGKPVFNVFFGQYLGRTHQVIRGGLVQRLTGKDVPVTYRHFSPFSAELRFDKFDENGKPTREAKGHVTLHVVDVAVLNRRRMKMWQRADCRARFTDFAHFTRTFTQYMHNLSQPTGIRVESVKLFDKEFGSDAAKVRDIMYETFGGRKRVDEGYINIPENGYRGNADGPNYPFHSLRFELLANLEKQPSVFQETFGNSLGALPYNHTEAYEGVRRNLMVGTGFRQHDLDNDKKFWSNGAGYEVRTDGTRYRLFSPYGNSIGVYPSPDKAFIGAGKHAKKSDPLDMSPVVAGEAPIKDPEVDITPTFREILSGKSNLMVGAMDIYSGERKFYNLTFKSKNNIPLANFLEKVQQGKEEASISLSELIGDMEHGVKLLRDYPEFSQLKVYRQNSIRGDVFQSVQFGKNHDMFLGLNDQMIKSRKFLTNVSAIIQSELQKYISHKEGVLPISMYHVRSGGTEGIQQYHTLMAISEFNKEYMDWSRNNPDQPIEKWMESVSIENANEIYKGFSNALERLSSNEQIKRFGKKNPDAYNSLIGWAKSLGNSFTGENPTSFILQYGTASIMVADRALLKLPENVMNSIGQSEYGAIIKFLQSPAGFTHGISKYPRAGSPIEIESRLVEESPFVSKSGQPVRAMVPNFILQNSELHQGFDKFSFFTITETGNKNDAFHTLLATNGGITTSTLITPNKPQVGSSTSDAKSYASNWLTKGGFNTNGTPITDVNASLIWSGDAPFVSFEKNGMSFKPLMSGEHIRILQEVASGFDFISPEDVKQIASVSGIERFSRLLWKNGLEGVQSRMAYNLCLGAIDIQKGIEIIKQSEEGVRYSEMYANVSGPINEPQKLGAVLMNDGYAKLALTMFENGSESAYGSDKFKTTPQGVAVLGSNQSTHKTIKIVDKLRQRYESAGYRLDDKVPHVKRGNASSLMVGGFRSSTAKEMEMETTGMLRYFRDSRGNVYKSYEFTDASASLNMHAAEGSISKLPFIRIADEDKRQAFLKKYQQAKENVKNVGNMSPAQAYKMFKYGYSTEGFISQSIPVMDLEEVLHHDLLYKFYPKARDIKVRFTEGYGASFNRGDKSITLGIDRFIGHEIGLDSELTETQRALDAQKFGIDTDRGATEVLLHEVQHAIQMEEGWIDSSSISNLNAYKSVFKYLMGKISGADGITYDVEGSKLDKGSIEMITGDANSLADVSAYDAIDSVRKMFNSPMHHRVRKMAVPAMHRVASSLAMRLHDEYAQAPDGFPDKELAIKHSNILMAIAKEAREVGDMLTRGEIDEATAAVRIAGSADSVYYRFLEARTAAEQELNGTPIGRTIKLDEPWDSMYLNKVIGTMTAYERSGDEAWLSDETSGSVILKSMVDNFGWMQYLAQPHEVQASQTGKRRKLTQKQLNASATETGYVRSGIEGFESIVTQSNGFGPSIAELGRLLNEGADSHALARAYGTYGTSNLMVGGLGKGESVTEYKKSYTPEDALNYLGRLSTVSHHLTMINRDYALLRRIAVSSSGFEVDKNGKVRLIFRTAEIQPSNEVMSSLKREGRISDVIKERIPNLTQREGVNNTLDNEPSESQKEILRNVPWFSSMSNSGDRVSDGGIPKGVIIANLLDEGNQNTMSFESLAKLLDAKITMEKIIETPIESINLVMQDDFPAVVKLKDLKNLLLERGISQDGLVLGNIDAITDRASSQDITYTKQELVNILAINHQIITAESVMGSSFGKERLMNAIKDAKLNPREIGFGLVRTLSPSDLNSIVRQVFKGDGSLGFDSQIELATKKTKFFVAVGSGISFNMGARPDWIDADAWASLSNRLREKGIVPSVEASRFTSLSTELMDGIPQSVINTLHEKASELNERFARKLFLIKPFYEQMAKAIEEKEVSVSQDMVNEMKVSMLSDVLLNEVAMKPEATLMGGRQSDRMLPTTVPITSSDIDSRNKRFGYETSPRPFGALALNINALGTMAASDVAMVATRFVQNPAVGMHIPSAWGYDSGQYKWHGDTPLNMGGGRGSLNLANSIYGYEEPSNSQVVAMMMESVGRHYGSINQTVLALNKIANEYVSAMSFFENDDARRGTYNELIKKVRDLSDIATHVSMRYDALTVLGTLDRGQSSASSRVRSVQSLIGTNAFVAKDGTYVVSNLEPVRVNAYQSHAGLTNFPYIYSGDKAVVHNPTSVRKLGDMSTAFMRNDYERVVLMNGDVVDENGNVVRTAREFYQNMLDSSRASIGQLNMLTSWGIDGRPSAQPQARLRPSRRLMRSGNHAIHSALYQLCARKGISAQVISNALVQGGANSRLIDMLKNHAQHYVSAMQKDYGVSDNEFHSMAQLAPVFAPFFAKAMSEKQVIFRDGVADTADIFTPEQRESYNNLFAYTYAELVADPEKAAQLYRQVGDFVDSMSPSQASCIANNVANGTIGTHVDASVGILSAFSVLDGIPDAEFVHLDALINGNFKEELKKAIGTYVRDGGSFWEKGLNEDVSPSDNSMEGYSHTYLRECALACMNREFLFSYVMALKNMDHFEGVRHENVTTPEGIASLSKTDGTGVLHSDSMQFVNRESYSYVTIDETQASSSGIDNTYDHNKIDVDGANLRGRLHALENQTFVRHFDQKSNRKQEKLVRSGMGMGQTFLQPVDVLSDSNSRSASISQEAIQSNISNNKVIPAGTSLSRLFVRKRMTDYLSSLASSGNGNVAIEPARFSMSGRREFSVPVVSMGASGRRGSEFTNNLLNIGAMSIGIGASDASALASPETSEMTSAHFSENLEYSTEVRRKTSQGSGENYRSAPFGFKPQYGFAFKKLEDGSIVVNVSGDIHSPKYAIHHRSDRTFFKEGKFNLGFSIKEGVGFDPYTNTILPHSPYINSGSMPQGIELFNTLTHKVSGPAWAKEIVKASNQIAKGGYAQTRDFRASALGTESFSLRSHQAYGAVFAGEADASNRDHVSGAYGLISHNTSADYVTVTFRPNTPIEAIRAGLHHLVVGNGMHAILANSNIVRVNPELASMAHLDASSQRYRIGESLEFAENTSRTLNQKESVMPFSSVVAKLRRGETSQTSTAHYRKLSAHAQLASAMHPHLMDDLDNLCGMIASKDSGYFLPPTERILAMNGDKASAIELMFPNRPELMNYAWDGRSDANVSIVPKKDYTAGAKGKVSGYLVGYNTVTGMDEIGRPVVSRKVVMVKTMPEAEALRAKFSVSTSKAELAMLLDSMSNETQKDIRTIEQHGENSPMVKALISDFSSVGPNENGAVGSVGRVGFRVGELDKVFDKKADAQAVAKMLETPDALSTSRTNLMVGDRNPSELENLTRAKLNFGSGYGPFEFTSKLMKVIAYAKKKTGRDLFPHSMTGAEWFKHIKENQVSKDEIRQSGLAVLLHHMYDQQLSRQELAEFIYTLYPQTMRISRNTRLEHEIRAAVDPNTHQHNSTSRIHFPFISDLAKNAQTATERYFGNLNAIAQAIEQGKASGDETVVAQSKLAEEAASGSLSRIAVEHGLVNDMPDTRGGTFKENIEALHAHYTAQRTDMSPENMQTGPNMTIRPAYLHAIQEEILARKVESIGKTVNEILGNVATVDPWDYSLATIGQEMTNLTYAQLTTYGNDKGPYGKSGALGNTYPTNPSATWNMGLLFKHDRDHSDWASTYGPYTSQVMQVEQHTTRQKAEYKKYIDELTALTQTPLDPAEKERINRIIAGARAVMEIRERIAKANNVWDAGHYANNPNGTLQLGHLRVSEGISLNETNGLAIHEDHFTDTRYPLAGTKPSREPLIVIEEIQSDPFQYKTFGLPSEPTETLPEDFAQIEGLMKSNELKALKESYDKLLSATESSAHSISQGVQEIKANRKGLSRQVNRGLIRRTMEMISPFEMYAFVNGFKVMELRNQGRFIKDTGRRLKVPESYRSVISEPEIPVYEFDFDGQGMSGVYAKNGNGTAELMSIAQNVSDSWVVDKLVRSVQYKISHALHELHMSTKEKVGSSEASMRSLMMDIIAEDEAFAMASPQILESWNTTYEYGTFDFESLAQRVIAEMDKRVEQYALSGGHNLEGADKSVHMRIMRAASDEMKAMLKTQGNSLKLTALHHDGNSISTNNFDARSELFEKLASNERSFNASWDPYDGNASFLGNLVGFGNYGPDFRIPVSDRHDWSYGMMPMGNYVSALGKTIASVALPVANYNSGATARAKLDALQAQIKEMQKIVPISGGDRPHITTSMFFGVEDIYRNVSLHSTVMKAAAVGYDQIGMTDARHHFTRGNSSEYIASGFVGKDRYMLLSQHAGALPSLALFESLPQDIKEKAYGNFYGRLKTLTGEEVSQMGNGLVFDHAGSSGDIDKHVFNMLMDAQKILNAEHPEHAKHIALINSSFSTPSDLRFKGLMATAHLGRSNLLGPDGKPIKYKTPDGQSGSRFFTNQYGTLRGGEKNQNQRLIDQSAMNINQMAMIVEAANKWGYASNYGLPMHYMELHFTGQSKEALEAVSTDSFDRPVMDMRDGEFIFLDPKTAKEIGRTRDKEHAIELYSQLSRYRGKNPYIKMFEKEYGPLGGYIKTAFNWGSQSKDGLISENSQLTDTAMGDARNDLSQFPDFRDYTAQTRERGKKTLLISKDASQIEDAPTGPQYKGLWTGYQTTSSSLALMLMKRGIPMKSEQAKKFISSMDVASVTLMRFKPRFPTEQHRQAWRKKAIDGIAHLMVGGDPLEKPKASPMLLETLKRVATFTNRASNAYTDDETP